MKLFPLIALAIVSIITARTVYGQNIMINVMTQNSGKVKKDSAGYFEVTLYNTSPIKTLPAFKIRPQISFPQNIVSIPSEGHILPEGWSILSNKNGTVTLSNGKDEMPENSSRTILIAMKGKIKGGPSVVLGNIYFSNGEAPGNLPGIGPREDNIADNISSSTVSVF